MIRDSNFLVIAFISGFESNLQSTAVEEDAKFIEQVKNFKLTLLPRAGKVLNRARAFRIGFRMVSSLDFEKLRGFNWTNRAIIEIFSECGGVGFCNMSPLFF